MKKSFLFTLMFSHVILASNLHAHKTGVSRSWTSVSIASICGGLSTFGAWLTPTKFPSFEENKAAWLGFTGLAAIGGFIAWKWWNKKTK